MNGVASRRPPGWGRAPEDPWSVAHTGAGTGTGLAARLRPPGATPRDEAGLREHLRRRGWQQPARADSGLAAAGVDYTSARFCGGRIGSASRW